MPQRSITPIILCGGTGSRLWPTSRLEKPKQFGAFGSDHTLLQETALRFQRGRFDIECKPPIVVGAQRFAEDIDDQMTDVEVACQSIILEPFGMDSAPALAVSLVDLFREDPEQVCCMLPSDHKISNLDGFFSCIAKGFDAIEAENWVITFGIQPSQPETVFGYIERSNKPNTVGATKVVAVHEKPDRKTAQEFFESGRFFWNSGMVFFKVRDMVDAFQEHDPKTWEHAKLSVELGKRAENFVFLNEHEFRQCTKQSLDYAILEKIENIGVVPSEFRWSDLGTWGQIYGAEPRRDLNENVVIGDTFLHDVENSYIRASSRMVAVAGLENVVVVEDDDVVLVVDKDKSGDVKNLYDAMKEKGRSELQRRASSARQATARKAMRWLLTVSVPFWAEYGIDRTHGGVFAHLNFDGSPVDDDHKRFRVLPRQIYCFAEAQMMNPAIDLEIGPIFCNLFDHMVTTGWHDEGGWIHHYNPDGSVKNALRDTYDLCFVLLACASLYKATQWPEAKDWAMKTLVWMDKNLSDDTHGGYAENNNGSLPRRANPHMHFMEAMLAWYETTGDIEFLNRAARVVDLFEQHFFQTKTNTLAEFFEQNWQPRLEGADALVEPGHHYEWAWLLLRFDRLAPREGLREKAFALFGHARSFGHQDGGVGAACDFMGIHGELPDSNLSSNPLDRARCWPQTEALKAGVEMAKLGVQSAPNFCQSTLNLLFNHYLLTDSNKDSLLAGRKNSKAGGWVDVLDTAGEKVAPYMPSSTWYHLFCALKVLHDWDKESQNEKRPL